MGSRTRWGRPAALDLGRRAPWWRGSRGRLLRLVIASLLALAAAASTAGQSRRAADTLAGLGRHRVVLVARRDLQPGDRVATDDVERRDLPTAATPPDPADQAAVGSVVTERVLRGEVVSRHRLAPEGLSGLAALVPAGRRAVALPRPTDGSGLPVRPGDRVDILAARDGTGDPVAAAGAEAADAPARDARVIEVSDGSVTVVVTPEEAAVLAAALARGIPVLALSGAG